MFKDKIVRWLEGNLYSGSKDYILSHQEKIKDDLLKLQIPLESQIGYFYLNYGADSYRGWYELNSPNEILDAFEEIQDYLDLSENFLPISGIEGGGVIIYDRLSGKVYDIIYEDSDKLLAGKIKPVGKTFEKFLLWAIKKCDD